MDGLTVGRMVHYVDRERYGEDRAAVVSGMVNAEKGVIDLTVYTNIPSNPVVVHQNVPYSDDRLKETWHWIERA